MSRWLVALALLGACEFGDNRVAPHGGDTLDAAIDGAHADAARDAAVDAAPPACALVPQAGCTGEACDLTPADDGTVACRPVTKQGTSNDHCAAATECKAGYTCTHDTDPAHAAWCSRFCAHDADCTGTGSRCTIPLVDAANHPIGVDVCSNACDPYGQTGCPSGMGCIGYDDPNGDYTDCAYMGSKLEGDACTTTFECANGLDCVDVAGTSTCEDYCIVGNSSTCVAPSTCVAFISPLVIGGVQYGACQ